MKLRGNTFEFEDEVAESVERDVESFVGMLPSNISTDIHERVDTFRIDVEREGNICIEWYGKHGDLIGSFYGNGKIIYAAVYEDDSSARGVANLDNQEEVTKVIRVIQKALYGGEK